MADESIDPRYAAQFQRGYAGPAVASDGHRETQSTRAAPARIGGGPVASAFRVPPPPPVRAAHQDVPVEPDPESDGEGEDGTRQHRLEWALLIAGILMIAAAPVLLYGYLSFGQSFPGPGMPDIAAQMRNAFLILAPGPLLAAGAIAVALWLVVRGLRVRETT